MSTGMKKTHPNAASLERVKGEAETGQETTSTNDNTTATDCRQMQIADLLLQGQENAIPLRQLKAMTGQRGRDLRKQIERERRRGIPVLSDNVGGYFLPANEGERERFVKSMRHRVGEILKSAAAIERG